MGKVDFPRAVESSITFDKDFGRGIKYSGIKVVAKIVCHPAMLLSGTYYGDCGSGKAVMQAFAT